MANDWMDVLEREAIRTRHPEFDHRYHVSIWPAYPPEYELPGVVGITFRLSERGERLSFVTALDVGAAVRLGTRVGLDEAGGLAMVDAHERLHIFLQLEGVAHEDEEAMARYADVAFWYGRDRSQQSGSAGIPRNPRYPR